MKILKVSGKNIASLEGPFAIDFREEPLHSAPLYAITGHTGAGKSTILDVICVALYHNTPRLSASSNIRSSEGTDELAANDIRQLLRRGATHGEARVLFRGNDHRTYEALWSVRRARNKANGRLQDYECTLFDFDNQSVITSAKTEFRNQVVSIIGLSYDQFIRSVLLAQGDFSAFLKAPDAERAQILEKVTGTSIYAKISQHIFQAYKEFNLNYTLLSQKIGEISTLSDDELQSIQEEQQELSARQVVLERESILLDQKKQWAHTFVDLQRKLNAANTAYTQALNNYNDFKPRRDHLNIAKLFAVILPTYRDLLNSRDKIRTLTRKKNSAEQQLVVLNKDMERLTATHQQLAHLLEKKQSEYEGWAPKISSARQLIQEVRSETNELKLQHEALAEVKKSKGKEEQSLQAKSIEESETVQRLERLSAWQKSHPIPEEAEHHEVTAITLHSDYVALLREGEELEQRALKSNESFVALSQHQQQLEQEYDVLSKTTAQELLELRASLVEGEPCPVCGSRHHDLSLSHAQAGGEAPQSIEQIRQHSEKLKEDLASAQKEVKEKESESIMLKTMLETNRKQRVDKRDALMRILGRVEHEENLTHALEQFSQAIETWRKRKKEEIDLNNQLLKLKGDVRHSESMLGEYGRQYKSLSRLIAERNQRIKSLREQLDELMHGVDPEQLEKTMHARLKELQVQLSSALEELRSSENEINKCTIDLEWLTKETEECSARNKSREEELRQWLEVNRREEDELACFMEWTPERISKEEQEVQVVEKALALQSGLLEQAKHALAEHAAQTPFEDTVESAEEQLKTTTEAQELNMKQREANIAQKTTLTHKIKENNDRLEERERLRSELGDKNAERERLARLNDLFGSATGDKLRRLAQEYALDVLLQFANHQLSFLMPRYTLSRISGTLTPELVDHEMLDERRSISTASGGETFVISLALALGLSSISAYNIHIDTMFIDEGFGSLDSDALGKVLDALETLQQQGRTVGVISHVAELNERIPVQICVVKRDNGRSVIQIKGNEQLLPQIKRPKDQPI